MATSAMSQPHVALFPASGMGHLLPQLRLAAMLASRGCTVTIIAAIPTVSIAEMEQLSAFFTLHPHINRLDFHILPHQKSEYINEDPFFIQFEAIAQSVNLLLPVLPSLTPPVSAIVADFAILKSVTQIAEQLGIPSYAYVSTSAKFFWLMANLPNIQLNCTNADPNGCIELPVIGKIPISDIPPPLFNPNHFFAACIHINMPFLCKANGAFINTLACFEPEMMEALNKNVLLGPMLPVGPLQPFDTGITNKQSIPNKIPEHEASEVTWLDKQDQESVLFISFGNRTALSKEQIHELAMGLEKSGCYFLWVLKGSKVDKDDKEGVEEIVGEGFLARTRTRGMVIKRWVDQDRILAHPSVGGFLSHCGWNSVMEAARLGVAILGWPLGGDQRAAADVVERIGLGLWRREWGWIGQKLVGSDEIAAMVVKVMKDKDVRAQAREVREKASRAWDADGASELMLQGMIKSLKAGN